MNEIKNSLNRIKDGLDSIKDGLDSIKKDLKVFELYMYILVALIIITIILLIVQSAFTFSLPKLKITYIKPQSSSARIVGKTGELPILTVDFVNKPLWKVLQDVSNDTGYVFTTKGVNLAAKVNLKGRYNFAVLLSKLFNGRGENTTVNLKTKRVRIWR